jgi:N4-gp56 family major capsid protein
LATFSTASSNFGNTVVNAVQSKILEELRANLVHAPQQGGATRRLSYQKGNNNNGVLVAYADFAAATTSLTEGSPPTSDTLTIATETVSALQYGRVVEMTDLADQESPQNVVAVAAEKLARNAVQTLDQLAATVIHAGTAVIYSGTATSRLTVTSNFTYAKLQELYSRLQMANVPPLDDGLYGLIVHPRQWHDIRTETTSTNLSVSDIWRHTPDQASQLVRNEVGVVGGFHILPSTIAQTFTTAGSGGKDVLSAVAFGREFLAMGDLQSINAYYVPAGGDHSDPLAQKAMVGFKMAVGFKLVLGTGGTSPRYLRLESAGTVLASGQV